jgi:hypothetical protein
VVIDLAALPDDADALRAIVLAQVAALADQRALIERLRLQLTRLRRMRDCRNFRVWGRTMLLKEPSYAATQTACDPG